MNEEQSLPRPGEQSMSPELLSETEQLNRWIFNTIRPWLKGNILEIGAGSGHIAEWFVREGVQTRLSDPSGHYCRILQNKFTGESMVKSIHRIKPEKQDFEKTYSELLGRLDTVLQLNLLEHEPVEYMQVKNVKKLLRDGGHLILLLPARTALYNGLEEGFESWKRENRHSIRRLWGRDLKLLAIKFFAVAEHLKWNPSEPKPEVNNEEDSNSYRQDVSIFEVEDKILYRRLGLSMIAVGRKMEIKK